MARIYLTKLQREDHTETLALTDAPARETNEEETNKQENKDLDNYLRIQEGRFAGSYHIPADKEFIKSVAAAEWQTACFDTFKAVDEALGPELQKEIAQLYREAHNATGLSVEEMDELCYIRVDVAKVYKKDEDFAADIMLKWSKR